MCIIFTCGEQTFRKEVEGYEGIVCRCYNCGNYSGNVLKSHSWFTFCFIPIIPYSLHGYQDVVCHVCNFAQPLESRPDVQAMRHGGGHGVPLQNQGGPGGPGGGGGPPPPMGPPDHNGGGGGPKPNDPMRYG